MTILEKTTWLTNGSSKTKNIMKSKLNLPAENQLEFHMLYDEEEYIFDQEQRCLLAFCDVRWTSRADILTCLLKHYSTMKRFLQEIQDKTSGYSDATSYKSMLQKFEILIVAVVTKFVLGYIRPLSIALLGVACDLVEAHIQLRVLVDTMGDIRKNIFPSFIRKSVFHRGRK